MATWGRTSSTSANGQGFTQAIYIELSNFPEGGSLDSISFYTATAANPAVRCALYSGGAAGNPNGASLVEDLGVVNSAGSPAWQTKNSTTNPTLVASTKYWIALKSNDTGLLGYTGADPGGTNLTGKRSVNTGESGDETNAWDATVPGAGTSATHYNSAYLTYTATPASSIVDVDTDNTVLDAQANVVITTTGITTASATVNIETSTESVSDSQAIASTAANSITLTSVAVSDIPLTTAGYQLRVEVVADEGNFTKNITLNPATGKSVVQVNAAPVIALVGGYVTSIFYGYTGTAPAIGDQIEYDTSDSGGNAITMQNESGNVDGQFSIAGQVASTTFQVRWWSQTDLTWSAWVLVTVTDGVIVSSYPVPVNRRRGRR